MSAATQNGMDKLIRERDRAREERDALELHVERLKEAGSNMDGAKGCERAVAGVRWCRLIESGPQTSLTRLKAEWQAEALENLAQANSRELIHPQIVMEMAADLLRQAEEAAHD